MKHWRRKRPKSKRRKSKGLGSWYPPDNWGRRANVVAFGDSAASPGGAYLLGGLTKDWHTGRGLR